MKKSFLIFATALLVASCGNNNDKAQKQVNETPVPQNVTVASEAQTTSQVPNTTSTPSQKVDPNTPVLKMEDGKPLDFSQLIASQNAKDVQKVPKTRKHLNVKLLLPHNPLPQRVFVADQRGQRIKRLWISLPRFIIWPEYCWISLKPLRTIL